MKKQGYNAKLNESIGERNKGKKKQSMKDRRDESEGAEKSRGKRKFSGDKSMDKATVKKTKVGSEFRVRDEEGKIRGEFNKKKKAIKRAKKIAK